MKIRQRSDSKEIGSGGDATLEDLKKAYTDFTQTEIEAVYEALQHQKTLSNLGLNAALVVTKIKDEGNNNMSEQMMLRMASQGSAMCAAVGFVCHNWDQIAPLLMAMMAADRVVAVRGDDKGKLAEFFKQDPADEVDPPTKRTLH